MMVKRNVAPSIMFFALLLCATHVRAESAGARSVEWLACDAEVIAVGRLKEVRQVKGPGEVIYEDCTLALTELLKSTAQKDEVRFTFRRFKHHPSMADWMHDDAELLVFLSTSKDHGPEKRLDGALVPTSMASPLSLVNLAEPGRFLIDIKFNVLKYGWEVLDATRGGLLALNNYQLSEGHKQVEMLRVEVPFNTEAQAALYAGSVCYLDIPGFMAQERQAKSP
jgi:hypothetical protein